MWSVGCVFAEMLGMQQDSGQQASRSPLAFPRKLLHGEKFRAAKVLFEGRHYLAKAGPCTLTESEGRWLVQWLRWKKKCYVTNSVLTKDIIFEGDPRYETTPAEHYP